MDRVSEKVNRVILDYSQPMTIERAKALGQSLADGSSLLTRLSLKSCGVGPTGCAALSEGVAHCTSLTELDLSCNPILDSGGRKLGMALMRNRSLVKLSLASCGIGARGLIVLIQALSTSNLIELDLSDNIDFDEAVCYALSLALQESRSLTKLNLSLCGLTETECSQLSKGVASSISLAELTLSHNAIKDEGAAALAEALQVSSSLVCLGLWGCRISQAGVLMIAQAVRRGPKRISPLEIPGLSTSTSSASCLDIDYSKSKSAYNIGATHLPAGLDIARVMPLLQPSLPYSPDPWRTQKILAYFNAETYLHEPYVSSPFQNVFSLYVGTLCGIHKVHLCLRGHDGHYPPRSEMRCMLT